MGEVYESWTTPPVLRRDSIIGPAAIPNDCASSAGAANSIPAMTTALRQATPIFTS